MYANVKTGICIEFDTEIMFSPEYKTLVVPSHEQERCEFPPILYTSCLLYTSPSPRDTR